MSRKQIAARNDTDDATRIVTANDRQTPDVLEDHLIQRTRRG